MDDIILNEMINNELEKKVKERCCGWNWSTT